MTERERARQRLHGLGQLTRPARVSKGERTRQRIIDSATVLFSRSGYRAVSLRDIAAHAGITHAGALHHFPNKEAMLIHVLSRRDEVDAPLVLREGLSHQELIDNIVKIVGRNTGTPGLVSLYVNLSAEATDPTHPAHEYFVRRYRVLRELLVSAFTDVIEQRPGSLPAPRTSPEVAAQQLLALQDGLQVQWLLDPETVDMRAAVVSFLRMHGFTTADELPAATERTGSTDDASSADDTSSANSTSPADGPSTTAGTNPSGDTSSTSGTDPT